MEKAQVFVINYEEGEQEKKVQEIIQSKAFAKIISKLNSIGEITRPYEGSAKQIEGIIDDLFLADPNTNEELKKDIRFKRCQEVQQLLLSITPATDKDFAYRTVSHVQHCHNCQDFVMSTLKVGGLKDLEQYIAKKLGGN